MSFNWLSKPLSIESIASKYTLPIVIQPALGLHGSNCPVILHSISNITFAFGRALKIHQPKRSEYQAYSPINSELVAVPMNYPGYFECLLPSRHGSQDDIISIKSIHRIVEQMQLDHRPQAFYLGIPIHVYTLERKTNATQYRLWHDIEAHQIILFNHLKYVEYTPTESDNLTEEDYVFPWWFCFYRQIINRNQYVIECTLPDQQICYIPCLSRDEVCLIPVGQSGSTNACKLQTIQNLIENFSLPINIKLAELPGCNTYKDFSGSLQLLGSHTEEFAICASLSSTNVSLIPVNIPLKFIVAPLPLTSTEITNQLSRCEILNQSFDEQIHRILISSHEISARGSRPKSQSTLHEKRSPSIDIEEDQTTITNDVFHAELTTEKKRNDFRKHRTISMNVEKSSPRKPFKRTLSSDDNSSYNSLVHPVQIKSILKQSSLPVPSPLPKKPSDVHHRSKPFTYDTGSTFTKDIDLSNSDGAILIDNNNKLFSILTSEGRASKF